MFFFSNQGTSSITSKEVNNRAMPDAEIVWVPDGLDNPQWNTVNGQFVVTRWDTPSNIISGLSILR
jgi:hypothetical protein